MRVMLTAVDPALGRRLDIVLDVAPTTPVRLVADRLAEALSAPGSTASARGPERDPAGARVLRLRPRSGPGAAGNMGSAPCLYVAGEALDPDAPVAASPLREGALVSLGDPSGCLPPEPAGAVEVRVVSGPGAGIVHRLDVGTHAVGAGPQSVVRLADRGLPEVALTLTVAPDGSVLLEPGPAGPGSTLPPRPHDRDAGPVVVPEEVDGADPAEGVVIDPLSPPALVELDRVAVSGRTGWREGTLLTVGAVVLECGPVRGPDASWSPSLDAGTLDYNRPPRLLPPARVTDFVLPSEPRRPDRAPFPLIVVLLPLLFGVAMAYYTRRPFYLLFGLLSPLMYVGQHVTSTRTGRRSYRRQLQEYRDRRATIERDARRALVAERTARRRDEPDPASLLLMATGPRGRLWERRRSDPDWLRLRVGLADLPSEIVLDDPGEEAHRRKTTWSAPDVPATVGLVERGVVGVTGAGGRAREMSRWLVAQLAGLHSPTDLRLVLLADAESAPDWDWFRWLPHARGDDEAGALASVAFDDEAVARRVAELTSLVEARRAVLRGGLSGGLPVAPTPEVVLVLDGARRLRLLPGVVALLRDGPAVGVRALCLDADERALPEEAQAVISADGPWLTLRQTGAATITGIRPDLVPAVWCERLARALAPIRDVSGETAAARLPGSSRLLDLLGLDVVRPAEVATAWRAGARTTTALIGQSVDGPFTLDLRRDGPHGLVAGTTGAGKSELLQTLIASLALGNRPDELTLVLVDYKGGAAFKDCRDLPHTVGMVTDLDGHLTERALASLAAELRRREHQLAGAGAKDIEDYLAERGPDDPPMPRLVLVVDEFATLVGELPDFVAGVVDIARRGRSLGVHLVLATQRPAGVVTNDIKANTNLRIALRVTDGQDSQDVIDAPDAAHIAKSVPGRAYARLGHSSLVAFQTARVGGRPPGSSRAEVSARPVGLAELGRPLPAELVVDDDGDRPTDLALLVAALRSAAEQAGVEIPPSPWLEPLPDVLTLDALAPPDVVEGRVPPLPIGLADLPGEQRQDTATWDLERAGHLGIVGSSRSGRSTALRAVAAAMARCTDPRDVHLYGLDCGNNALLPLVALPHTGAVVARDQVDRVSRLTARLQAEIGRRQQLLAERGYADVSEQRRSEPAQRLPYLLVLLDRWEGFVAAFDGLDGGRLVDAWLQILQEGAGVGVKVVLAGDRTTLVGRVSTLLDDRLVLRLTDPSDYTAIGMLARDVPASMPPGRAFRAAGLTETQLALLDADPAGTAQVAALQALGAKATLRAGEIPVAQRPFRVDPLPARVEAAEALALAAPMAEGHLLIGVGGDTLGLRTLDADDQGPAFLVAGPPRSGRSTALLTLLASALSSGWQAVALTPRRSPLRELEGTAGLHVFGPDPERADVTAALESAPGRSLLVVDDLELLGQDGPLAELVSERVARVRDTGSLVVAAGTLEDLGSMYRGPVTALKRTRTGLLLNPSGTGDGDLLGVRLPRSLGGGSAPPGRGVLVSAGRWELVQVALPRPEPAPTP